MRVSDPHQCPVSEDIGEFVRRNQNRYQWSVSGLPFLKGLGLSGYGKPADGYVSPPAFVDELIERITDYNVVLINRALAYDTDCIRFGDDWGMQRGLIFGKKLWDRFIKPAYSRMFRLVKESGKDVMLHSCGDVKELFPDLIDMGLDIFIPQPERTLS